MPPWILPAQALADAVQCLGLGLLAAAVRCLLPRRRGGFWADFCCMGLALVLLQGFAAGRSQAGVLRWYMLAAAGVGAAAGESLLRPLRDTALRLACGALALPWRLACRLAALPAGWVRGACRRRRQMRGKEKNTAKKHKKQLPSEGKMLYNSNM